MLLDNLVKARAVDGAVSGLHVPGHGGLEPLQDRLAEELTNIVAPAKVVEPGEILRVREREEGVRRSRREEGREADSEAAALGEALVLLFVVLLNGGLVVDNQAGLIDEEGDDADRDGEGEGEVENGEADLGKGDGKSALGMVREDRMIMREGGGRGKNGRANSAHVRKGVSDLVVDTIGEGDEEVGEGERGVEEELIEELVVAPADGIVDPGTVVVHSQHATA